MMMPKKLFKIRLPADVAFWTSPPEKRYSQPAMMILKKKTRPAIKNMKSMRLKPPPVRRSEIESPGSISRLRFSLMGMSVSMTVLDVGVVFIDLFYFKIQEWIKFGHRLD